MHGQAWRTFQSAAANLFVKKGFVVEQEALLSGARGHHKVDVWATLSLGNLSPRIIVECKSWNRRVSKAAALSLYAVVQDVGATHGILVTIRGVQAGCRTFLENHTAVRVFDLLALERELDELMATDLYGFASAYEEGAKSQAAKFLKCKPTDIDSWPPITMLGSGAGVFAVAPGRSTGVQLGLSLLSRGEMASYWSECPEELATLKSQSLASASSGEPLSSALIRSRFWIPIRMSESQLEAIRGARVQVVTVYSVRGKYVVAVTLKRGKDVCEDYPRSRRYIRSEGAG